MNRSVQRQCLAVSGVRAGEVAVVTRFDHPVRGLVECPAAPLLDAELKGLGVRRTDIRIEPRDGLMFMTSYLDRNGHAFGLAAAAHAHDPRSVTAARDVVRRWSACLRTRRVLVAIGHDCGNGCDLYATTHKRLHEYLDRGDTVVQVGAGQRLPGTVPVRCPAEVCELPAIDPDHLSFVISPGAVVEEVAPILTALRSRFPRLRGPHPDEWCYAQSDHREAVRSVAGASDLLLVCGVGADADRLQGWAGECRRITDVGQLRPEWLLPAATVGIVAPLTPSSASPDPVADVLAVLSGLGPVSVARRQVTTEVAARSAGAVLSAA